MSYYLQLFDNFARMNRVKNKEVSENQLSL